MATAVAAQGEDGRWQWGDYPLPPTSRPQCEPPSSGCICTLPPSPAPSTHYGINIPGPGPRGNSGELDCHSQVSIDTGKNSFPRRMAILRTKSPAL